MAMAELNKLKQMIYKCDPVNLDELHCIHLEVMKQGNSSCIHRTKHGYCARFTDRQIKDVVDKLGQIEECGCVRMTELQKLKYLLDGQFIAYEQICDRTLALETKPVFINDCPDGLYVYGWGFSGFWPYSAEFLAKAFDRKFREEVGR